MTRTPRRGIPRPRRRWFLTAGVLLSGLVACLLGGCSSDEGASANESSSMLTGTWRLSRSVSSNTCGLKGPIAISEEVGVVGCEKTFSLVNARGLWAEGELMGTSLTFTGTETDTNLFGCQVTYRSSGEGTHLGARLEALMTTTVSFDPVTCGARPDCQIEWSVTLQDLDIPCGCYSRAQFPPAAQSPYVLPFPPGQAHTLGQGYCCERGTHRNLLAVDFRIPLGDEVVAARAGTVRRVIQHLPDDGVGKSGPNLVQIEHPDGTVATYAHLQQWSAMVEEGDMVEKGQNIARGGNSGQTNGPHLHFVVHRRWPPQEGEDLPTSFANAAGRFDCRGGPVQGETYRAMPF